MRVDLLEERMSELNAEKTGSKLDFLGDKVVEGYSEPVGLVLELLELDADIYIRRLRGQRR